MADNGKKRLIAIKLAKAIGNVSEACRRTGIDRSSFYKWKRRFDEFGREGLADFSRAPRSHPQAFSTEVTAEVVRFALENPELGCIPLARKLGEKGISISSPTVQKILIAHGLGLKRERLFFIEERFHARNQALPRHLVRRMEKSNPCFKERAHPTPGPGGLLVLDVVSGGFVEGIGELWLQTVVDTFSVFGFATVRLSRRLEDILGILHGEVLPFYRERRIPVQAVLSGRVPEFAGRNLAVFERFLKLSDIECLRSRRRISRENGYMQRFLQILMREFFRHLPSRKPASLEEIQIRLHKWLQHYNFERRNPGFPNQGKPPADRLNEWLAESLSPPQTL